MAALANRKIIPAERALAVVTRHATQRPTRRVMIERLRRGDLPPLRHAGPDLMAFIAGYLLMFHVAEADSECGRKFRCAGITAELMTHAT